jgi:hypothetical protein
MKGEGIRNSFAMFVALLLALALAGPIFAEQTREKAQFLSAAQSPACSRTPDLCQAITEDLSELCVTQRQRCQATCTISDLLTPGWLAFSSNG